MKQQGPVTSSHRPSSASDELPTPPGSPIHNRRESVAKHVHSKHKAYPATRSRVHSDPKDYMESDNQTNDSSYDDDGMYKEGSDDENYED